MAVIASVRIAVALDKRGVVTPFVLLRALTFRNLSRYRTITQQETGKVGPLYRWYVIPINTALVLAIIALVIRAVGM